MRNIPAIATSLFKQSIQRVLNRGVFGRSARVRSARSLQGAQDNLFITDPVLEHNRSDSKVLCGLILGEQNESAIYGLLPGKFGVLYSSKLYLSRILNTGNRGGNFSFIIKLS